MATKKTFAVWRRDYYESEAQMWPRKEQQFGRFKAVDEDDLKAQLTAKGRDLSECRWEEVE